MEYKILRADRSECNESNGKEMAGCLARDDGSVAAYFPTESAIKNDGPLLLHAPELLEALERAKRVLEDIGSHAPGATRDEIIERIHMGHDGILREMGAAIAKAKGKA